MSEFHYSPRVGRYLRCKARQQCPFETHRSIVDIAQSGGGEISTNGHGKVQQVSDSFAGGFSVGTGAYSQHFWVSGKKMTAVEARVWKREKAKVDAAGGVDPDGDLSEIYETQLEIMHRVKRADRESRERADHKFYTAPVDQAKLQAEFNALFECTTQAEVDERYKASSRDTQEAFVYLAQLAAIHTEQGKRGLTKHLTDQVVPVCMVGEDRRRALEYHFIAGVPLTDGQRRSIESDFGWLSSPDADEEEAAYRQREGQHIPDYDPEAAERMMEAVRGYKIQSKAKDSLWNRMLALHEKAEGWQKEAEAE